MSGRSRFWMLTSFNNIINFDEEKIKYCVYQREKCPKTQREHWQIYCVAHNPVSLKGIKNIFNDNSLHGEIRESTHENAVNYCTKIDTRVSEPVEFGSHNERGKRNDLKEVCDLIKQHGMAGIIQSIDVNPTAFVRYSRGLLALAQACSQVRHDMTELYIYWGAPGTGKTRTAYEAHNKEDIYMKNDSMWWDGYTGQPYVIIDDYAFGHKIGYTELLRLADRYPYQVQVKGGTVQFLAKRIYITSNEDPNTWFNHYNCFGQLISTDAMKRRITFIKHFE